MTVWRPTHDMPARTVLEELIRARRQTLEEFAEFAETFAREHDEPGTLSVRHLQRLTSGRGPHGQPVGRPRPATARLLERIFGTSMEELLSAPDSARGSNMADAELRQLLRSAARVDESVVALLHDQLTATRRLDRQLGATIAHGEVITKISQVTRLLNHSVTPAIRDTLAELLSELHTLAGWQALDMGDMTASWKHYEHGKSAAAQCGDPAFAAHTGAGHAFVLIDLADTRSAVALLDAIRQRIERKSSRLIRSWLAAAHGEALAADGQREASLRAFDRAQSLLNAAEPTVERPYVALDQVHLARWRGHALARIGEPDAVEVLTTALDRLDPTFVRAETALRADLATAFTAMGEREPALQHAARAEMLAEEIGSARQRRRVGTLRASLA